jgi:hypothetical protein
MKKGLIIGGGVLLLGGIAYLYFTNKKKQEELLSGATTPTTPTTSDTTTSTATSDSQIPPLSTGGIVTPSTKATTVEEQEKLDKANDIVVKIKKYEKTSSTFGQMDRFFPSSALSNFSLNNNKTRINPYPILINKLKDDLLKLGYEYKGTIDGVLVKL